jgi:hypothetical protein
MHVGLLLLDGGPKAVSPWEEERVSERQRVVSGWVGLTSPEVGLAERPGGPVGPGLHPGW